MFGGNKKKGKMDKKKRVILMVSAAMLIIVIGVAVIFLTGRGDTEDVADFTEVPNSVCGERCGHIRHVEGAGDICHCRKYRTRLLDAYACTLEYDGEIYTYTADDFNLSTDYKDILDQAVAGSASDTAQVTELTVSLVADQDAIRNMLSGLKQTLDKAPVDATVEFAPSGYTEDGTIYEPDPKALADAHAVGDELERPELVRRDETDTLNELRYLFWNEDRYEEEDFIPADADILRFRYTEDEDGLAIDVETVAGQIQNALETGDNSTIVVSAEAVEAEVTVEDLKEDTQLITSWTSSYRDHSSKNRNWNVSRMSSFVNNVVIQPGKEWSINDTAGPRNASTARDIGWKKAAGLYQGGTTQQYGGGVCQLGSTTYNAALRADLTIDEFHHHSDPSGYIPKGLDATLESGSKDLVLRNDGETPVYLVSYVDPEKKTVTVEVYGRLLYSEKYDQPVIYDFTSDNVRRYGSGGVRTIPATKTPDGDVLSPENPTIVFSSPRAGYKVDVYKFIYALDGTELEKTLLRVSNYKPINGYTYVYPEDLMPSPSPTGPSPTPADPTPTPADPTPTPADPTPTPARPDANAGRPDADAGRPDADARADLTGTGITGTHQKGRSGLGSFAEVKMNEIIRLENAVKMTHGNRRALSGVNLCICEKQRVAVCGPPAAARIC